MAAQSSTRHIEPLLTGPQSFTKTLTASSSSTPVLRKVAGLTINVWPSTRYLNTILPTTSLVGYWRLDDISTTAADQKGTYPGAYSGTYSQNVSGLLVNDSDGALSLSGAGGVGFTFANTPVLSSDFSMETWIKPNANATGNVLMAISAGAPNFYQNFFLALGGFFAGNMQLVLGYGATTFGFSGLNGPMITAGNVYHIVGTYQASTGTWMLYVNGAFYSSRVTANAPPFGQAGMVLGIGKNTAQSQSFYNGIIDEAAIYNTPLSASTIQDHYAAGTAGYAISVGKTVNKNLTSSQAESPNVLRSMQRNLSSSQTETPVLQRLSSIHKTITQAETPTLQKLLGVNRTVSQAESVTVQKGLTRFVLVSQGQFASIRTLEARTITVGKATVATVLGGSGHFKILSVGESTIGKVTIGSSKKITLSQASNSVLQKSLGRFISTSEVTSLTIRSVLGASRIIIATELATPTLSRRTNHGFTTTISEIGRLSTNQNKFVTVTQSEIATIRHPFVFVQAKASSAPLAVVKINKPRSLLTTQNTLVTVLHATPKALQVVQSVLATNAKRANITRTFNQATIAKRITNILESQIVINHPVAAVRGGLNRTLFETQSTHGLITVRSMPIIPVLVNTQASRFSTIRNVKAVIQDQHIQLNKLRYISLNAQQFTAPNLLHMLSKAFLVVALQPDAISLSYIVPPSYIVHSLNPDQLIDYRNREKLVFNSTPNERILETLDDELRLILGQGSIAAFSDLELVLTERPQGTDTIVLSQTHNS